MFASGFVVSGCQRPELTKRRVLHIHPNIVLLHCDNSHYTRGERIFFSLFLRPLPSSLPTPSAPPNPSTLNKSLAVFRKPSSGERRGSVTTCPAVIHGRQTRTRSDGCPFAQCCLLRPGEFSPLFAICIGHCGIELCGMSSFAAQNIRSSSSPVQGV